MGEPAIAIGHMAAPAPSLDVLVGMRRHAVGRGVEAVAPSVAVMAVVRTICTAVTMKQGLRSNVGTLLEHSF